MLEKSIKKVFSGILALSLLIPSYTYPLTTKAVEKDNSVKFSSTTSEESIVSARLSYGKNAASAYLTKDGKVHQWENETLNGALPTPYNNPKPVRELKGIKKIINTADAVVMALSNTNIVYRWSIGYIMNEKKIPEQEIIKDAIGNSGGTLVLAESGNVYMLGSSYNYLIGYKTFNSITEYTKHPTLSGIKQIKQGNLAYFAITDTGDLLSWGYGNRPLGLPTTSNVETPTKVDIPEKVKKIDITEYNVAALTEDGSIYTWGNLSSATGLGGTTSVPVKVEGLPKIKDISVHRNMTLLQTEDGKILFAGRLAAREGFEHSDVFVEHPFFSDITSIYDVFSYYDNVFKMTQDDSVYVLGYNQYGELGLGHKNPVYSFTKIAKLAGVKQIFPGETYKSFFGIKQDGTVITWSDTALLTLPIDNSPSFEDIFTEGNGTSESPYMITSPEQLNYLYIKPNAYFKLDADIDASGVTIKSNTTFSGTLDGNNKTITGATIDGTGLFKEILNATVKNLTLKNFKVLNESTEYVGVLVGRAKGSSTLSNIHVVGGEVLGFANVGGVTGRLDKTSTLSKSSSSAKVGGGKYIGGLSGYVRGIITESSSSGEVYGKKLGNNYYPTQSVGGLVGYLETGTIERSFSSGVVTTDKPESPEYYGGLVGLSSGTINDSYSDATVTAPQATSVGGLLGNQESGVIKNTYSTGLVYTEKGGVGGLIGFKSSGSVVASFWDLDTTGQTVSAGGTGKSHSDMLKTDTFSAWSSDVWRLNNGVYPKLQVFKEETVETPKGFTATRLSDTNAQISWEPVTGAESYELKRGTETIYTGSLASFTDSNLELGKSYTYTVTAKKGTQTSESTSVTYENKVQIEAKTPTNAKVIRLSQNSVTIRWDEMFGADYYIIRESGDVISTGSQLTRFTDTGLISDASYEYSITAVFKGVESAPAIVKAKTSVYEEKDPIEVKPPTDGTVEFAFNEVPNANYYTVNRNPEWTYTLVSGTTYKVDYYNSKTGERSSWVVESVDGKLPFNEAGLSPGNYNYQVDAYIEEPDGTVVVPFPPVDVEVPEGEDNSSNPSPTTGTATNYKIKVLENTLGLQVTAPTTSKSVDSSTSNITASLPISIKNAGTVPITITSKVGTINSPTPVTVVDSITAPSQLKVVTASKTLQQGVDTHLFDLKFNWGTEDGESQATTIDFTLSANAEKGDYEIPVTITATQK